jgi:peptide/nickel transport system ATP-binding protein
LFDDPRHPYAHGLIGSLPPIDGPRRRLIAIAGTVPDPKAMPQGCAFAPRCGQAAAPCGTQPPRLRAVGENRRVACVVDQHAGASDIIGQAAE